MCSSDLTSLGDEKSRVDTARALRRATPFLRRQIAGRLRLRRVPEIEFRFDESVGYQDRVERIIQDIHAEDDLRRVVRGVREKYPGQRIHVRMDSGFAAPATYDLCEELQIEYSIGLGMNARLKEKGRELLAEAQQQFEKTKSPQRLFTGFEYQADS